MLAPLSVSRNNSAAALRSKASLADAVYADLRTRIFAFGMAPGERYSENDLAASFAVSRTPLRAALRMLERDGLIENIGGHSCWRVRPLDLGYYEDLYDFRIDLEALGIRRLARRGAALELAGLKAAWHRPAEGTPPDGEEVAQRDEAFHIALVDLCGNREMARVFRDLTGRIRTIRRLDFVDPARIADTYREHGAILLTLGEGRFGEAEQLLTAHIERSRTEIRNITLHRLSTVTAARTKGAA